MPILVLNMGGEMLYVLEQRLVAQSVDEKKKNRVLRDVVRTMFSNRFVSELFKPQSMYTDASIRQVFEKLAHSSIMKLNETSMNKLYSLMVMGVKYQLVKCVSPRRMLDVTLEHVQQIKLMCQQNGETDRLLDECSATCAKVYGAFSDGDWLLCRQMLLQFFKGRKVRVSVFLQMQVQSSDGTLALDGRGPLPENARRPGTVLLRHVYRGSGGAKDDGSWIASKISHHPLIDDCLEDEDYGVALARALSASVYKGERISPASDDDDDEAKTTPRRPWSPPSSPPLIRRSTAKEELSLLSDLVVGGGEVEEEDVSRKDDDDDEVVILDLFSALSERKEDGPTMMTVDGIAERKSARDMARDLLDIDAKDDDAKRTEESEDLFDLLDEAKL